MQLPNLLRNKFDPNIIPDKDDPNLYCRSCDKILLSKASFRHHLHYVHKMNIIQSRPARDMSILPDVDDPNFYCKACKKTYVSRSKYRFHLTSIHSMELKVRGPSTPIYDPNIKIDYTDINNTRCGDCKLIFKSRGAYNAHLKKHYSESRKAVIRHKRN
jgi:uncharacterized C2H2 Zn-finger protein